MGYGKWLRRGRRRKDASQFDGHQKQRRASDGLRANLSFEPLEDRRLLATYLVSNLLDLDPQTGATELGSLRWAVERANA
jgi:hypothetical protein